MKGCAGRNGRWLALACVRRLHPVVDADCSYLRTTEEIRRVAARKGAARRAKRARLSPLPFPLPSRRPDMRSQAREGPRRWSSTGNGAWPILVLMVKLIGIVVSAVSLASCGSDNCSTLHCSPVGSVFCISGETCSQELQRCETNMFDRSLTGGTGIPCRTQSDCPADPGGRAVTCDPLSPGSSLAYCFCK